MPFINALGYNVFDPTEVTPELNADVGIKKGEKVDYAILKDGEVIMLFECKAVGTNLDRVTPTQLFRYFTVTRARIGVLTNGVIFRFFSDLEEPNKMDTKPFLEFNLLDIQESVIPEIKKLTKSHFDQDAIIEAAGELKYTKEIRRLLGEELKGPSEDFVKLFASRVYSGRLTQAVKDQFTRTVQKAFRQFIHEEIADRLKSALQQENSAAGETPEELVEHTPANGAEPETTSEELEGYHIVRAILRQVVAPNRIAMRDVRTYLGILLDDNNRKPLARLHFNTSQKYVGLFDNAKKSEERVPIGELDDIYALADRLKKTVTFYDGLKEAG
jgi:predicted type IV restriction endonuclease